MASSSQVDMSELWQCWHELWESCTSSTSPFHHPMHPTTPIPCTDPSTMCDFCQRTQAQPSQNETVISATDNCLEPATMCDPCRTAYNELKTHPHIHQPGLLAVPGTYPVYFIRRFKQANPGDGSLVSGTREFIDGVASRIRTRLQAHFRQDVGSYWFAALPAADQAYFGMLVLVDFPEYVLVDARLFERMFGAGEDRKWTFVPPRRGECLSWFRLSWWKMLVALDVEWLARGRSS
ncbi:hypothetical protein BDV18DRAFT_161051 [Aspergillus unguis]